MEIETITLEDNVTYMVTKEIENYVYLTNINDEKDFCIRRIEKKDNEEYFVTLDSNEEFDNALALFAKN